jgi:subtilisin family serine protease
VPGDSITDRYIVIFKPTVGDARTESDLIVGATGGKRKFLYEHVFKGFSIGNLPPGALKALQTNPHVASVERVAFEHVTSVDTQSTPFLGLWGLDRIDQRSFTTPDYSYKYAFSGQGVRIYVLDTGIDPDRTEYSGRVAPGVTIDGGGRTDGLEDDDGHGTAMASLAAGTIHGTAKGATLIPVRVGNDGQNIGQDQVVAGFDWLYANAVVPAVVTYSITNYGDAACHILLSGCNAIRTAVERLWDRGIATVHAAGNESNDACLQFVNQATKVIVAGGTTQDDMWNPMFNFGGCITLEAPATNVGYVTHGSDAEVVNTGTSIAAPLVAGVIAQILQERPSASPDFIKSVLVLSATPIPSNNAPSSWTTGTWPAADPKRLLNSWHRWLHVSGGVGQAYTFSDQYYTWNVDRLGGDGNWTYQWWETVDNGQPQLVSTGTSYTRLVRANDNYFLYLQVYATSAGETVTDGLASNFQTPPSCGQEICP